MTALDTVLSLCAVAGLVVRLVFSLRPAKRSSQVA